MKHTALAEAHEIPFFPYPQVFQTEEAELVQLFRDVGRRGAFVLQPDLACFERNLAGFLGAFAATGVGNATDGLWIALKAAGVGPGDEVIFCSHTMTATAAAIHFAGATPVPVDCGADHLIDPMAVEEAVTSRTRAILPTHLNGRTADMPALGRIAKRHSLLVIEDAAQALGSKRNGIFAGTFGDAGAISFYPAKLLGCLGDGGAVIASNAKVADRVWALHDHGRDRQGNTIGWGINSRLDNLQAAFLDYQLGRLEEKLERRRALARLYRQQLVGIEQIVLPPGPEEACPHSSCSTPPEHYDVYQNYEIEAARRDELKAFLGTRGIGTLLPWGGRAVHQHPALGLSASLPQVERLLERALLLPMHPWLKDAEVELVCRAIRTFYRADQERNYLG